MLVEMIQENVSVSNAVALLKKAMLKKAMAEIESQYYAGKVFTKPKDITFAYYVSRNLV